jgi:hypothetical protein
MEGNSGIESHKGGDNKEEEEEEEEEEKQLVQRYMEGGGCRRVVLDGYLDGTVDGYQRRWCGDASAEQACDQCNPG